MKRLLFIILFSLTTSAVYAANFYVDLDAATDGNGTAASPWNNLTKVNNRTFAPGDDVYFKCGTTSSGSEKLEIKHSGVSTGGVINYATFGAYYMSGATPVHGVNGDGRPTFKGTLRSSRGVRDGFPAGDAFAMIKAQNVNYIYLKDIYITESGERAIGISGVSNFIIRNMHCYKNNGHSILIARNDTIPSTNGLVEDCLFVASSWDEPTGANLLITGLWQANKTTDITVRRCTVRHGYEGIGCYKMASDITIEDCTIYDNRSYNAYVAGGANNITWRRNIVYNTPEKSTWNGGAFYISPGRSNLFIMDLESHLYTPPDTYHNIVIEDNYIAGGLTGIGMSNSHYLTPGLAPYNITIRRNRLADNQRNINIASTFNGTNVAIDDNISAIYTSPFVHVSGQTGDVDINWNANTYNSAVSGRPATNQIQAERFINRSIGVPPGWLGWRDLSSTAGDVTVDTFAITGETVAPVLTLTVSDATAVEGTDTGSFTITCAETEVGDCTGLAFTYDMSGTAINGTAPGYVALSGSSTIVNAATPRVLTITPIDDEVYSGTLSAIMTLTVQ